MNIIIYTEMLKYVTKWVMITPPLNSPVPPAPSPNFNPSPRNNLANKTHGGRRPLTIHCGSRRRVRYEYEDDKGNEQGYYYGYNKELSVLENYTQSYRKEALLIHALLDGEEVQVLVFKGFSSCLSYETAPDPSKSVLPERAVIRSVDRIRGPFDPSNIEYLEKGLSWESFKSRLIS